MFQTKDMEKIRNTHFVFSNFSSEMRSVYETWYSQTVHRRQCNTAHARCMLDK